MCGVIGIISLDSNRPKLVNILKELFIQSSIRGLHSTGISWLDSDDLIQTHIVNGGPQNLFDSIDLRRCFGKNGLSVIGHVRYSTSSLEYPQPIFSKDYSLVHNGVISQEPPELWAKLYGVSTTTENDSELILRLIESDREPLLEFRDKSMAVCVLSVGGSITTFRNHSRPLYITILGCDTVIITSTCDIISRTLKSLHIQDGVIMRTLPSFKYNFSVQSGRIVGSKNCVEFITEDQQIRVMG
jgi:glutamine phosphoribosylpyrophosphate amidotransferase